MMLETSKAMARNIKDFMGVRIGHIKEIMSCYHGYGSNFFFLGPIIKLTFECPILFSVKNIMVIVKRQSITRKIILKNCCPKIEEKSNFLHLIFLSIKQKKNIISQDIV